MPKMNTPGEKLQKLEISPIAPLKRSALDPTNEQGRMLLHKENELVTVTVNN